jgi:hypothetical protein
MTYCRRLAFACSIAVFALTIAAGPATANRSLGFSSAETRTRTHTGALTFTEEGASFSVICEANFQEEPRRSIGKTRGNLLGNVIGFSVSNCRGGTVRVLAPEVRAPWPVKYESFSGTLPNITSIRRTIERFGWLLEAFFGLARCLYGGNIQDTSIGGTTITGYRMDERIAVPLVASLGGFECPRQGIFRGSSELSPGIRMTLL